MIYTSRRKILEIHCEAVSSRVDPPSIDCEKSTTSASLPAANLLWGGDRLFTSERDRGLDNLVRKKRVAASVLYARIDPDYGAVKSDP